MAFIMMKKKKYKFNVDICVEEMTAVPFVNAVLFAKVRLLDGGFSETCARQEVQNHSVRWGAKFNFVCKMSANASTCVLDPCMVRVSVRKELKGGRSYRKLGFTDFNLAEYAGAGLQMRRFLLEGYDARHRQDNSMLQVSIRMNMISGDVLFKVPSTAPIQKEEENSEKSGGSVGSVSSGLGSLSKKRPPLSATNGASDGTDPTCDPPPDSLTHSDDPHEPGHSRNSSNTSQMSKASGYSSLNSQSQHSRQSSSGDSGHIRNTSTGSGGSETGSLDRGKSALERRKKANEEGGTAAARVEITRVNPDSLIEELLRSTNLTQLDSNSAGLKLFIAKDGTAALTGHDGTNPTRTLKQVVIEEKR